jgi:phosphate acyltransferase
VLGVRRPRVALLSNGEEPTKGTPDVIAVHARLAGIGEDLNFVGNVEGTGLTAGVADVIVTDGFTGNVALKLLEGTSSALIAAIRDRAASSPRSRLGGLLMRPALRGLRDQIDPEASAAYMLGLRRVGVVCHGRFTRRGFQKAIELAARAVDGRAVELTHDALDAAGALRGPSASASTVPAS